MLEGQVAIVTGAGRGLGRAIAEEIVHAGGHVAMAELDVEAGRQAAEELSAYGVEVRAYPLDVSDREQVDAAVESVVRDFGRLDILVNNAGVSHVGPHIIDTTDAAWHSSLAVMQTGVFYGMRSAARHMLPQGSGSVVNISSIRGFSPNPGRVAYCAAKAAVLMMTRVAAGEWARAGVRCNAVAPGVQRTPMWDADVARGAIDEDLYLGLVPAGRLGIPSEVGKLVVFLCSEDAAYINGSCIAIDGALTSIAAG